MSEYICQHDEFCGRISSPHSTACMDANVARLDGDQCVFIDVNELQRQAELDKIGTGENDHGMAASLHASALNVLAAMTSEQRALQAKRAEERRARNQGIRGGGEDA
ncbi:hypothetical protein HUN59_05235 [Curtobacterium sp. Csp2]|uniref:hypothetical protein n=1 Tax=Curtobacterium sp. Csp2 TaxID=2495430 RepID=UPI00157FC70B|nr:hypothetical protein [Curtobacterium sp. Csp2]QKS15700.1 hypothetical protein HUN59_05235 [Curtobacterium sp. Csp2]